MSLKVALRNLQNSGSTYVSTKGTLTWVAPNSNGQLRKISKKIMWMDGYDAWRCIFSGVGDSVGWGHWEGKPTSYGFTFIQSQKLLKLSPKFDNEDSRECVRERTLDLHRYNVGQLINDGFTFGWLSTEEHQQLREYYLEREKEHGR